MGRPLGEIATYQEFPVFRHRKYPKTTPKLSSLDLLIPPFAGFRTIQAALLRDLSPVAHAKIQGTTDSEHFAALFFTNLDETYDQGRGQTHPRPSGQWKAGSFTTDELKRALQKTSYQVQTYLGKYNEYANSDSLMTCFFF